MPVLFRHADFEYTLKDCPSESSAVFADEEGRIGITDFGIAVLEAELAREFEDRQSLLGQQSPSGGFHKRHLVRLSKPEVLLNILAAVISFELWVFEWSSLLS